MNRTSAMPRSEWNFLSLLSRKPWDQQVRMTPRKVTAKFQTNWKDLKWMKNISEKIFIQFLTLQIASISHKLSHCCQSPVIRLECDNICPFQGLRNTTAVGSTHIRMRTAQACRWRKIWWCQLSCGPGTLAMVWEKKIYFKHISRLTINQTDPRWGLIEKMWTSLRNEKIIPPANAPSDNNIGSNGDHCSRGYQGFNPALASRWTVYHDVNRRLIQTT